MADNIFHNGMAEALGVSQAGLEEMDLRQLAELAYDMGYRIDVGNGDLDHGLTLYFAPRAVIATGEHDGNV